MVHFNFWICVCECPVRIYCPWKPLAFTDAFFCIYLLERSLCLYICVHSHTWAYIHANTYIFRVVFPIFSPPPWVECEIVVVCVYVCVCVCLCMKLGSVYCRFKFINEIFSFIWNDENLALNNPQEVLCHKTPRNQLTCLLSIPQMCLIKIK